jgi:ribosomal protein L44E
MGFSISACFGLRSVGNDHVTKSAISKLGGELNKVTNSEAELKRASVFSFERFLSLKDANKIVEKEKSRLNEIEGRIERSIGIVGKENRPASREKEGGLKKQLISVKALKCKIQGHESKIMTMRREKQDHYNDQARPRSSDEQQKAADQRDWQKAQRKIDNSSGGYYR